MTARSIYTRSSFRRSNGGGGGASVTSISVNGGAPLTGAIALTSPMLRELGGNTVAIWNGNVAALVDAATIAVTSCELANAYSVTINGARTFGNPAGVAHDEEKITFAITIGAGGPFVPAWSSKYRFANAASPQGVKLAAVDELFGAAPAGATVRVGFAYSAAADRWDCVALAGYW